ncbi:ABC transporter permease [Bordetella parapertussis]|uniref:ABC transporter permease protein n=4 Tax=Bordetella TaxID=517 RepID=Q7W6V7_BORPA|nr:MULTISPECIES: ABC transporter permease [Bordetella]SHS38071.1 ABC-type spermidine/putrescine transport system, permease component I [Mycobacteroides abscessus subsp. abscessus]AOB39827.1 ABC transporter permease [Bordetella parapertussis]AUL43838.1 ABC transporter permease [Bordetella parapertussis]AWP62648.1 ABC transporter permease [Bordetella parapertussis]AWP70146.1 ABC transporter permease [Bordetella parapertussis]
MMRAIRPPLLLLAPPALLVALFVVGVGYLVVESLHTGAGWGLDNFVRFFERPDYVAVLVRTIVIAVAVTACAALVGYPIAYAIARYRGNRNFLMMLVIMPWLVSVVVRTYGWMVILGPRGTLNSMLLSAGVIDTPLRLIFNMTGVVIGLVHVFCPFFIVSVLAVLLYLDRSLDEASQTLSAGPFKTFWHVTLPLSMPGVITGAMLVYLLSTGAIVTPLLLGGVRDGMLATQIYQDVLQVFDYPKAASMAVVLLLTAFTLVIPLQWLERRVAARVSGRGA